MQTEVKKDTTLRLVEVATTDYYHPNEDELYLRVSVWPDGERKEVEFHQDGSIEVHSYDADGNEL